MVSITQPWHIKDKWNVDELRTEPFKVTKILKENSIWVKELDIREGDVLFIETINGIDRCDIPQFRLINMSANLKRTGKIGLIKQIQPSLIIDPTIPETDIFNLGQSKIMDVEFLSWRTITDEQINHRNSLNHTEPQLNL